MKMKAIGINVGAGSISIAVLEGKDIIYKGYQLHKGKMQQVLQNMLNEIEEEGIKDIAYAVANDAAASLYQDLAKENCADRIVTMMSGAKMLYPQVRSVMEIGAQTSSYVTGLVDGETVEYAINGECAAGTGAFFEDQMFRLGMPLEAYSEYTKRATQVPRLAGRCSVFAKTDLIHRQQEGYAVEDILLGLAYAVIRNYKGTVVKKLPIMKPVVLAGGVVKNEGVVTAIKEIFGLKEGELIATEEGAVLSAIGLAVEAQRRKVCFDWKHPKEPVNKEQAGTEKCLKAYFYEKEKLHQTISWNKGEKVWLGIDVGSTSTNLALINRKGEMLDYQYLRTKGAPSQVVAEGMAFWEEKYQGQLCVEGIGVTGSGRYLIAEHLNTKNVVDEITAQARAAAFQFPDVDTVFEIGGQDSKTICIKNQQVVDFEMNKVCAAGTGSFLEEQAGRLGVELQRIGESALQATNEIELGERCTVLMESKIATELAKGTKANDICAGLCRSIVRNYLNRVVNSKKVGDVICLQGGVMHNEGIVAAFHELYGDRIRVPSFYDVTGAYGAALEAKDAKGICTEDLEKNKQIYGLNQKWFYAGYDGRLTEEKKTIGIPRSLMIYKFFPMAYKYFTALGFQVLLSQETDEEIIALSQELVSEETCYPIKLMYGHMESLVRKGVDYIFIPRVRTMHHATSNVEHNYGCVYMQTAPVLVAKHLEFSKRNVELISPILDLDMGKPQLSQSMVQAGVQLGKNKLECMAALAQGAAAMVLCEKETIMFCSFKGPSLW